MNSADSMGSRRPARAAWSILVLVPGLLMAQPALASGKYLDVIGEIQLSNSKTTDIGKQITVQEDWMVGIQCTDRIRIVDHKSYWTAATTQYWDTLVQVDGKTIAIREGHIPQGKKLGAEYSGGVFSSSVTHHDKEITWPHAMVFWKPAGQGMHEVRCVANYGGTLSDNTAANNTAIALVEVVPAKVAPPVTSPPPATTPPPVVPALGNVTARPQPPRSRADPPPAAGQPEAGRRPARPPETPPARPDPEPADNEGLLRALGCHRPDPAVMAFVCTTREGLARCERMMQQREVRSCKLRAGREPRA